jgi:4-amino-4-deoxy-L-arabinose transferase-like glycosyltransferase
MHDPRGDAWAKPLYSGGYPPYPILGWLRESTAFRLPALLLASLLVTWLYWFGAEFFNRRVALAATLAWMFQPHAFWLAHLAVFDLPIAAMWFLTAWCFLKAERGGWRWTVATGLAWGLALSTKHNAYFIPPTLVLWWLLARWRDFRWDRTLGGRQLKVPGIPAAFFAMLLLSPIVYYVLWPRLWFEPIKHLKWYFGFHSNHVMYWAYYFGWLYTKPPYPLGFSFIMSSITLPGPTVVLGVLGLAGVAGQGLVARVRALADRVSSAVMPAASGQAPGRDHGLILFVFLNFFVPFAMIANTKVPIFGGTKHWLPGMPFFCLLAGIGFDAVLRALGDLGTWLPRLGGRRARTALAATAAVACLAPAVFDTLHAHRDGSTYYNAFVGGRAAMGDLRLEREFWGNSAFGALPWLNARAADNARVAFHDTTVDSVDYYRRDGTLRHDVIPMGDAEHDDIYLFHWHKEFLDLEEEARTAMGVDVPEFVVAADGVPLLDVWAKPDRLKPEGLAGLQLGPLLRIPAKGLGGPRPKALDSLRKGVPVAPRPNAPSPPPPRPAPGAVPVPHRVLPLPPRPDAPAPEPHGGAGRAPDPEGGR